VPSPAWALLDLRAAGMGALVPLRSALQDEAETAGAAAKATSAFASGAGAGTGAGADAGAREGASAQPDVDGAAVLAEGIIALTTVVRFGGKAATPCISGTSASTSASTSTSTSTGAAAAATGEDVMEEQALANALADEAAQETHAARCWVPRLLQCVCGLLGLPCAHDIRTASKVRDRARAPRT